MTKSTCIGVEIVRVSPEREDTVRLSLPVEATVADALRAASNLLRLPAGGWPADQVGIFGQRCNLDKPLREGDRIELYQPLELDAKSARRLRARRGPRPVP